MSEQRDDNEIMELTEEMASSDAHVPDGSVSEASGRAKAAAMRSTSPFALLVDTAAAPKPEGRPSVPPEPSAGRPSGSFETVPVSSPSAVVARPIHELGGGRRAKPKRVEEKPAIDGDEAVMDLGAEMVVADAAQHAEEAKPEQAPEQALEPAPEPAPALAPMVEIAPAHEPIMELQETQVVAHGGDEAPPAPAASPEHPFDFGTPEMVFDEVDHGGIADELSEAGARSEPEGPESEEIDLAEAEDLTSPKPPAMGEATAEAALLPQSREKIRRKRRRSRDWWLRVFDDDFVLLAPERTKRELRREVDFIDQALGVKPGSLVLDLACGAGWQSVAMAKRNYRVVGVDLSLSMLARAGELAQEAGQKINFIHGDMRDLGFDRTFDAVYCIGTSFGFFDEDTNRKVLESVHKALKPGAAFLLEIVNRDYVIGQQPNLTWFEGKDVVCMEETDFNYINSRLYVTRQLIIGGGVRQSKHEYSLRMYSLHEIGLILHATGFSVNHVSGNISTPGVFFGAESPRLIIRAERRD